ncbi:MAG TPA: hypothetical protein VEV20_06160 [Burkholderiales bacterium]|nr:hypothetical protein [Burkholderiales bacterium]
MKTHPLLAVGALALLSCNASAYQIIQSHFHVEVGPNKYVDQLVLRCEDGKEITVPWQSKLAESCGEDLIGNVTRPHADAKAAPIDEQQKQAMMAQLRSQYGNISDKQVEFVQGASGTTTHFKGPMVEVLKKYESCRKTHKDKTFCANERDRAMAQLADPEPAAAAPAESPAPAAPESTTKSARTEPPVTAAATQPAHAEPVVAAAAQPARAEAAAAATPVQATPAAAAPTQPTPSAAAPAPQPSDAELRAAAERKIADDYAACMRAKPKFDCEQSRAKALSALEAPKPAKPQRPRKQAAAAAVETQASR